MVWFPSRKWSRQGLTRRLLKKWCVSSFVLHLDRSAPVKNYWREKLLPMVRRRSVMELKYHVWQWMCSGLSIWASRWMWIWIWKMVRTTRRLLNSSFITSKGNTSQWFIPVRETDGMSTDLVWQASSIIRGKSTWLMLGRTFLTVWMRLESTSMRLKVSFIPMPMTIILRDWRPWSARINVLNTILPHWSGLQ